MDSEKKRMDAANFRPMVQKRMAKEIIGSHSHKNIPCPSSFIPWIFALISSRNGFAISPALTLIPFEGSAKINGTGDGMMIYKGWSLRNTS